MSEPIVAFDEEAMKGRLRELVRKTAEDTLNALLEEEADGLVNADRCECTVLVKVSKSKRQRAASMLKAIHAMEPREVSLAKAEDVAAQLESEKLREVAKVVRDGVAETLVYTAFLMAHWRRMRANNAIERLNREIRRCTRVVGAFPDGQSAFMLVTAGLKYVASSEWSTRRYLGISLLGEYPRRWRAGVSANLRKILNGTI